MSRDGSLIVSDGRGPTLGIACELCGPARDGIA
jgi:hypothetical protein